MYILGIETSCDETAAAIVDDQRHIHAHVVFSQDHASFGGVIPEVAAREHLQRIESIVHATLEKAPEAAERLSVLAVTSGPGLSSCLWIGIGFAKALAWSLGIPLVQVNHLEGHVLTVRLTHNIAFPYLALVASGGHCELVFVRDIGAYQVLGRSIDDAAGEAFDKVARLLGFPYPGGRALEACACAGDPHRFTFPRPLKGQMGCNFSFAGLKTAARTLLEHLPDLTDSLKADFCASFQQAIVEVFLDRFQHAFALVRDQHPTAIVLVGGVAANQKIRSALEDFASSCSIPFVAPPADLCTDNGAMIAWAGLEQYRQGRRDTLDFAPHAQWALQELSCGL